MAFPSKIKAGSAEMNDVASNVEIKSENNKMGSDIEWKRDHPSRKKQRAWGMITVKLRSADGKIWTDLTEEEFDLKELYTQRNRDCSSSETIRV